MPIGAGNLERDGDLIQVLDQSINVNESVRLFFRRALDSERLATPSIELFRHFFARLFDSEFVSSPGQLKVILGGVIGILASLGGILAQVYYHKYLVLHQLDSPDPYRRALLADILFLETLVMVILGLFTAIQWSALYPTLRDYLALAALPIRMRQIFVAKFASLTALAGGVLLTITSAPSFILPAVIKGHYEQGTVFHIPALFVSATLAGLFVFFSLIAVQGIVLNLTPVRHFGKVSLTVQGLLVAALIGGLPFVLSIPNLYPYMDQRPAWVMWAPPVWFVAIHQTMMGVRDPFTSELARRAWIGAHRVYCRCSGGVLVELQVPSQASSRISRRGRVGRRRVAGNAAGTPGPPGQTSRRVQLHRQDASPKPATSFDSHWVCVFRPGLDRGRIPRGFAGHSIWVPGSVGGDSPRVVAIFVGWFTIPVPPAGGTPRQLGVQDWLRRSWSRVVTGRRSVPLLHCAGASCADVGGGGDRTAGAKHGTGGRDPDQSVLPDPRGTRIVLVPADTIYFLLSAGPQAAGGCVDRLLACLRRLRFRAGFSDCGLCGKRARTTAMAAILLAAWYGLRYARRTSYEIHRLEFEELPETIVETLSIEKD